MYVTQEMYTGMHTGICLAFSAIRQTLNFVLNWSVESSKSLLNTFMLCVDYWKDWPRSAFQPEKHGLFTANARPMQRSCRTVCQHCGCYHNSRPSQLWSQITTAVLVIVIEWL